MPADDAAFEATYAEGRFRRGVTLVLATGAAAVVALGLFLTLDPPKYVARWDENPVRLSDDGRQVLLTITGRDCDDSVFFELGPSGERVRVTAVVTQRRLRPCRDDDVPRSFWVPLDPPLGDRPLLDGRCTHEDAEGTVKEDCPAQPVVPASR